jgi:DNA-binding response OmpR family regulator
VRVLLVEDSPRLQSSIERGLRKSGYAVDACGDGVTALARARETDYDVILLDLLLPRMDGWSVLKHLRESGKQTHVLVLSAKSEVDDRVQGLRLGADDYLGKPFSFDELLARVDALTRRGNASKNPEITIGELVIDTVRKSVRRRGVLLEMTAREYRLLEYLAFHRGRTVSRDEIEEHIYNEDRQIQSNAVDSAICALRSKLDDGDRTMIRTRRGFGYCLEVPGGESGGSG